MRFHRPDEGINIAVGPQTCYAASPSLIRRGAELRKKHNLAGHIHLLETQGQALQSRQYFGEGGALGMLRDTGFLALPGTSCAHAVWLDDKDIQMMARERIYQMSVLIDLPDRGYDISRDSAPVGGDCPTNPTAG